MFTRQHGVKSLPGSHLIRELPDLTADLVERVFGYGAGMRTQDKKKYSESLVLTYTSKKAKGVQFEVSLYMCFGVWRIGGFTRTPEYVFDELEELIFC